MSKLTSFSRLLRVSPIIILAGLFSACGSVSDVAIAPEPVAPSNILPSASEPINQSEAVVLVERQNSQTLIGEVTDLEGNTINLRDPAALEGEPVEVTGRVIRAPRDLTGLWLIQVEGDGLKLVFANADTILGISEVTPLVTFADVTGSQITNSLIVATRIDEGIRASLIDLLNELIASLLTDLNSVLADFIISEGLDPLDEVISGSETLGSINLGLCTASASASFEVENLTGLSSLRVDSITLGAVDASDVNNVTGNASAAASVRSTLSVDAGGRVRASCRVPVIGTISESVGISGSGSVSSVSASGTLNLGADLKKDVCLNSASISGLNLNVGNVNISLDGLGIFNIFLNLVVDIFEDLLVSALESTVESAIDSAVDSALDDVTPLCLE